jgi:hypothetical protein
MHHDRRLSIALHLLLHVGAILDILPEIADVAADLLVRLERERDDGDEAEGEPFPECVSTASFVAECVGGRVLGEARTSASSRARRSCRSSGIAR